MGGALGEFCSGEGSSNNRIVNSYVAAVEEAIGASGMKDKTIVDLGCGDFTVGRRLLHLAKNYIGVDIVRPLIERNHVLYGAHTVSFQTLDIIKDELPPGDICFLRQVLQHLSNEQIITILKKLDLYNLVFITEHYPSQVVTRPNVDKVHGGDTRLENGSAVFLEQPPFCLPKESLEIVLEVAVADDPFFDSGVLRTFLFQPGKIK